MPHLVQWLLAVAGAIAALATIGRYTARPLYRVARTSELVGRAFTPGPDGRTRFDQLVDDVALLTAAIRGATPTPAVAEAAAAGVRHIAIAPAVPVPAGPRPA